MRDASLPLLITTMVALTRHACGNGASEPGSALHHKHRATKPRGPDPQSAPLDSSRLVQLQVEGVSRSAQFQVFQWHPSVVQIGTLLPYLRWWQSCSAPRDVLSIVPWQPALLKGCHTKLYLGQTIFLPDIVLLFFDSELRSKINPCFKVSHLQGSVQVTI